MTRFRILLVCLLILVGTPHSRAQDSASKGSAEQVNPIRSRHLLLVTGAGGQSEYSEQFSNWTTQWEQAAKKAKFRITRVGKEVDSVSPRQQLAVAFREQSIIESEELWIVLIGHGTFDGKMAKFNLVGEDLAAKDLAAWLEPREEKTVIINCASSSAPFAEALTGPDRIVVTSTKSGYEMSFSRFGEFLANAISDPDIDLDKDGQTSLLEAVVVAAGNVEEFYKSESRLATEHAMIEDNGDGRGTPAGWFRGTRVVKKAKDGTPADGLPTNQVFFSPWGSELVLSEEQIELRNQLERDLDSLRQRKNALDDERYYLQLEKIVLRLASMYEEAEQVQPNSGGKQSAGQ